MRITNKPRLVLALLVVVFTVLLGVALYVPAFVTSGSTQNPIALSVTPFSYIHSNAAQTDPLTDRIPPANYSGLFYVQHVCVYHE